MADHMVLRDAPEPVSRTSSTAEDGGSSNAAELRVRWDALCRAAAIEHSGPELFRFLVEAHRVPERHYHTLDHVLDCLRKFDALRERAPSPLAIELAVWFHDAIYDSRRADNEEKSAELAYQQLQQAGVEERLAAKVRDLVVATRHDAEPVGTDQALLVDVDLSILGQPDEVFDRYEAAVRREFDWVTDTLFWRRRAEILASFLSRGHIYHDAGMATELEAAARRNLARSIARAQERG